MVDDDEKYVNVVREVVRYVCAAHVHNMTRILTNLNYLSTFVALITVPGHSVNFPGRGMLLCRDPLGRMYFGAVFLINLFL